MSDINLSEYVGREVIGTLDDNSIFSGVLTVLLDYRGYYFYSVAGWQFNKFGKGLCTPQIKSIQLKNPMTGIAQQHPNINLEDFEGQRCYVKWSDGEESVGCVKPLDLYWDVPGPCRSSFKKDGTHSCLTKYVEEIYGEGAFQITTKDTFDVPSDDVVKKATETLKDLTEEQIAKVLHALKTK